jgi:hypothetical protein
MHAAAAATPDLLRLSIDAKATVKVGPFARGGKSRATTKACDHDFKPAATVTPVGILLPATLLPIFARPSRIGCSRTPSVSGRCPLHSLFVKLDNLSCFILSKTNRIGISKNLTLIDICPVSGRIIVSWIA